MPLLNNFPRIKFFMILALFVAWSFSEVINHKDENLLALKCEALEGRVAELEQTL